MYRVPEAGTLRPGSAESLGSRGSALATRQRPHKWTTEVRSIDVVCAALREACMNTQRPASAMHLIDACDARQSFVGRGQGLKPRPLTYVHCHPQISRSGDARRTP